MSLADYAAERQVARESVSAAEGKAWHAHFGSFYKLVFEHISTLVEVYFIIIFPAPVVTITRHTTQI